MEAPAPSLLRRRVTAGGTRCLQPQIQDDVHPGLLILDTVYISDPFSPRPSSILPRDWNISHHENHNRKIHHKTELLTMKPDII